MLSGENIYLEFDKIILKNVNIKLHSGEFIGLVGRSGAGKSSLLKILAGHQQATSGRVCYKGKEFPQSSSLLIPGYKHIELVNQDFKLDPYHSVEENIRESILTMPNDKRERRVKKMLRLFELDKIATQKAHLISGGEQQRVAIARSVAKQPDFLLLDEPFGHLDTGLRNKLKNYLSNLREEENTGILLVSHDEQDVLGLSDKVCILKNGNLSRMQSPEELFYNLAKLNEAELLGTVNSIIINGEKIRFRPDEYEINHKSGIPVKFIRSIFAGGYYDNIFLTEKNERFVLLSTEKLEKVAFINVRRKRFN